MNIVQHIMMNIEYITSDSGWARDTQYLCIFINASKLSYGVSNYTIIISHGVVLMA